MLAVLEELRALGVQVIPQGDNIVICPASKVPPRLKERLREQKAAILEALRNDPSPKPESPKGILCRYDWQDGYRGLRLHCVAHNHVAGTATVFRTVSSGRDVLLEMRELGILAGQALEDSRRVN
jgi:hypothetical protein